MMSWFNSPAYWYVIGFGGQIAFSARFIVQWIVSERRRRVVIPEATHHMHLDRPERGRTRFLDEALSFLSQSRSCRWTA